MTLLKHLWRSERARHALIAAALAALLGSIDFFEPARPREWQMHAQIASRPASGDIVFVEIRDDPSNPSNVQARREVAGLVSGLTQAGARKIVLNIVFDRPAGAQVDQALRDSIARSGRTVLAQGYVKAAAGERLRRTLPEIAGSAPQAINKRWLSPFGYQWFESYSAVADGLILPSVPAAITGKTGPVNAEFPIDYSIDLASIPFFSVNEATAALASGTAERSFGEKTIVIGGSDTATDFASVPGKQHVPPSIVAILAAETLKIGPPLVIGWFAPLLLVVALLLGATLALKHARRRRLVYAAAAAVPVALLFTLPHLRIFADLTTPVAFLAIFAVQRLWHMRQEKAALTDALSGLPSFRQLEQDLAGRDSHRLPAVVVAKVHRFDAVLSSLATRHHGDYVRLTADRLRIADEDLVVYSNGGRYLAWMQEADDEEQLFAHLTGLRAVLAHPLDIAGTAVDVGITFGADATTEDDAARKIAAAAAAAERTTEAHTPVLLACESSQADRLWNVSLQAKIDQALRSGEIYVVYQPQFDILSGTMFGAEALVRWNDRERGHISPAYFIEQCEQVGRMDALTKKVFEDAIGAVATSPLAATDFQLSINVSAILLHDLRVAAMLSEVLSRCPFPARRLTLEITETSRISDYDTARLVMDRLRALGVRLSIDDFGVGATSMETLLLLPFDELKIDRMFVSRVRDSAKARCIVESLVKLGSDLRITTVAEGVEDAATLSTLKEIRCDAAQGYFLGRPNTLDSFANLATSHLPSLHLRQN
ncbi:EAL domain-containing protein [Altererythrobacter soli]|uniref:EAL domain-containing protein n=1 Tax=Croceibacterium soli TaxID=1739690 RepID=A0A6I4UVI8_9SPHN|nr:EAL domain-containing protein [Croceibacterium soli]MXP41045.1 EAL domain-containing protein [Croceibacterium soli]